MQWIGGFTSQRGVEGRPLQGYWFLERSVQDWQKQCPQKSFWGGNMVRTVSKSVALEPTILCFIDIDVNKTKDSWFQGHSFWNGPHHIGKKMTP